MRRGADDQRRVYASLRLFLRSLRMHGKNHVVRNVASPTAFIHFSTSDVARFRRNPLTTHADERNERGIALCRAHD